MGQNWVDKNQNIPIFELNSIYFERRFIRYAILLSLFILGLTLSGCKKGYTHNVTILRAESVLFTHPDSAYQILLSIKTPQDLPEEDYAAWCLHYTHVRYKLNMDIPSDSLVLTALNYYSSSRLYKYTAQSYYLLGRLSLDRRDNKQAMRYFKEALYHLNNSNEFDLIGLTEFSIGQLYITDEINNQAFIHYRNSLHYFKLSNNKKYQAYAYRALSDIYCRLKVDFKLVLRLNNASIITAKEAGDTLSYYRNLSRRGELLSDIDYYKSISYLTIGYKRLPELRHGNAAFLAFIYAQLHNRDSTEHYIKQSLEGSISDDNKLLIYLANANVNNTEKNNSFRYLEKAYNLQDSLYKVGVKNQLTRIDKQYDLTQRIKENDKLKIDNQSKIIVISLLVMCVLAGLVVFLIFRTRQKQKQASLELRNQQLEFKNHRIVYENEQKRKLLMLKLQNRIKNTLRYNRLKVGYHENQKHDEFLLEITQQAVISEKEWNRYMEEVDLLSDGKIKELMSTVPKLSALDMIVICLISLGVNINQSCSLLDMNVPTMYQRRKRIKARIGFKEDIEIWTKTNIGYWKVEDPKWQDH